MHWLHNVPNDPCQPLLHFMRFRGLFERTGYESLVPFLPWMILEMMSGSRRKMMHGMVPHQVVCRFLHISGACDSAAAGDESVGARIYSSSSRVRRLRRHYAALHLRARGSSLQL